MASIKNVRPLLRIAVIRGILKYTGGDFKGQQKSVPGGRKNTPANSTIIAGHFRPWNNRYFPALTKPYARSKKKRVGNRPMLVFSGQLEKSIVGQASVSETGAGRFLATFPDAKSYAKFQGQHGRPPTQLQNSDVQLLEEAIATAYIQLLRAAGRVR